jgi:hypothetical protein
MMNAERVICEKKDFPKCSAWVNNVEAAGIPKVSQENDSNPSCQWQDFSDAPASSQWILTLKF